MSDPQTPTRSLAEIGRDAARAAQREALLTTLEACGWNIMATARTLQMSGAKNVRRAITTLGLTAEYSAAKAAGRILSGRPKRGIVDSLSQVR